jgi:PAS domain S-box-containing protein
MKEKLKQQVLGYVMALAAIAAALAIRWPLYPLLDNRRPYLTLFAAVAFAVWFARWRPAVLAAIIGFLAANYYLADPQAGFVFDSFFLIEFAGYALSAGFIIFFGEAMHRARDRLQREALERQHAEESERRQKELLRVTLVSIGDAVITTDAAGCVIAMNAVAEAVTGWNQIDAAGRSLDLVFRIVNEQTRETVENPATRAMRDGITVGLSNHTVLIAKDGSERPIDDSAAPIKDDEGRLLGCVLVFRDITARRRLERENAERAAAAHFLASLVRSSEDAIISKSLDGTIRSWNSAAERLFGYTADEAIGQSITMLIPSDRVAEEGRIMARIVAGERVSHYDTVRLLKNGETLDVSLTISPITDDAGNILGASKIVRDISEAKKAQRQLWESRELLRVTLGSIGDAVLTTDTDGCLTYLNAVAESVTGWTQQDAVGRQLDSVFRIVNEQTRHPVENPATRALREGVIVGLANHTVLITKNGNERPIDDSAAPIKDAQGRVLGCVLIFRDITERRIVEQQVINDAARLAAVLNHVIDGIITIDENGIVEAFNPAAERLFGYRAADVIGKNIKLLMPEPFHDEHDGYLANYRKTGEAKIIGIGREVTGRRQDGSTFPMELAVSEFSLSGQRYFTGIVRDITERKRTEKQVYDLLVELKGADRQKDEFLAVLAHELRGPLAPLSNMLEIMKRAEGDGELVRHAHETMERQLRQLVRLVDDLLDVSRISSNKLELRLEDVELAPILHQAVEICRPLANDANHELNLAMPPGPVYVRADSVRLAQVFGNLLSNACKYTEPGGQILVSVERQGSDAVVKVKDTGVGIPADMLPRVFEMFTQVDRTFAPSQVGLGIGLSLVKRLVEMHGGSVSVTSDGLGKGSEFTVRLPIIIEGVKTPKRPERTTAPLPMGLRVLVVDDNRDSAWSLAMLLKIGGNETAVAFDGMEAVEVAQQFAPDLVLLDIGLPKLNGYEAARQIRELPGGKNMMLVALTGWGQEDDRRKSKEVGFDHHLVKPVDHNSLMILLDNLRLRKV